MKYSSRVKTVSPLTTHCRLYMHAILLGLLTMQFLGCDDDSNETGTGMNAGTVAAGEVAAREVAAREVAAGEVAAGEVVAGEACLRYG